MATETVPCGEGALVAPQTESPVNRGILLTWNPDGTEGRQPVAHDESVLNIRRDLIAHLNEEPLSDEWLLKLRDYCNGRLQARAEARATGRLVFPQGIRWEEH